MSWDRFKRTTFYSANAVLAGRARQNGWSAPRDEFDFGRVPKPCEAGALRRLARVLRRKRNGPAPGAQSPSPARSQAALLGGHPVDAERAKLLLMNAQLERVLPQLRGNLDDDTRAHADVLATLLTVLEPLCSAAAQQGVSIERVLSEIQNRWGALPVSQALTEAKAFVTELYECLGRQGVGEKPLRKDIARAALILAMPGLHSLSEDCEPQARLTRLKNSQILDEVSQELASLDAHFAGRPGYAFDRLFTALCNHARILELGRTESTVEPALAGLSALIATVQESIGPDRDGYALNALVGIDSNLDTAIASLRTDLVARFMTDHANAASDPASDRMVPASEHAKDLVDRECELARARNRLMRAFDRAGVKRPAEVLRGLKMDAALVAGLTNQLGPHAKTVGLAIMGVYLCEQDIANSDSGGRMRRCINTLCKAPDERVTAADARDARLRKLAAAAQARAQVPREVWTEIEAHSAKALPQREILRAMQPRAAALRDPGPIGADIVERLGLAEIAPRHVRQLERQGISSAAEAYAVLALVQNSLNAWEADEGPQRMQSEGLLDVLSTRRQEERAVTFGETLLSSLREPDGSLRSEKDCPTLRRDLARAAILHLIPSEISSPTRPGMPLLASFRPAVTSVQRVLGQWSIDADLAAEIQTELGEGITMTKLAIWASDADLSVPAAPPGSPKELVQRADSGPLMARRALVESLADVKIGTRVRMSSTKRVKLSSGVFGDSVGVGVRASAGRTRVVDFGNPGDPGGSYEVTFRAGGDVKVGVDITAAFLSLSQRLGLKLGPVVTADAAAQGFRGIVLRCKTSQGQQSLTRKLVGNPEIGFDALEDVDSIMFLRDVQGSAEVGAGVMASMGSVISESGPGGAGRTRDVLGARITGSIGVQHNRYFAENNKGLIQRNETVTFGRVAASASLGVSLKPADSDAPIAGVAVAEVSAKIEMLTKERLRLFAGPDGKVVDAEAFNQSYVAGDSALDLVIKLGGPVFKRTMQLLEQESPEVYRHICELIAGVGTNELASLAWQLDRNAGFQPGNAVIEQANAVRDHRVHAGSIRADRAAAAKLRNQADRIFNDKRRYNIARVADIAVVDTVQTKSYLLGLFETLQTVYAEALPVEIKLYAEELQKLAVRARKEIEAGLVQ
ncbi:MAG: hypothetical protein H7255_13375 [Ramlibacter sp.]|nr:hypothetical protein [Ramlibacter sp.]